MINLFSITIDNWFMIVASIHISNCFLTGALIHLIVTSLVGNQGVSTDTCITQKAIISYPMISL